MPEVILNNFNTRLGHSIGRLLASLFPHDPQFNGRQVVTFHNQRDFIFFRHHRYAHFLKLGLIWSWCGYREFVARLLKANFYYPGTNSEMLRESVFKNWDPDSR